MAVRGKRRIEEEVLNLGIARRKDRVVRVWSHGGSAETSGSRLSLLEMIFLLSENSLVLSW